VQLLLMTYRYCHSLPPQQKWGVFLHYLETVVVSSSTTACAVLHKSLMCIRAVAVNKVCVSLSTQATSTTLTRTMLHHAVTLHSLLYTQQAVASAASTQLRAIDTSSSKYPSSVAAAVAAAPAVAAAADSLNDDNEPLDNVTEHSDLPDDVIKRLPRPTPTDAPPPQVLQL
jgi:ATP phosphoribosyltransferase regulatory subunit HisZ